MENHDYEEEPMPVYDDKNHPIAIEKDGYRYDPPSWKVCDKCDGKGFRVNGQISPMHMPCSKCKETGYLPIHYTPEQWEKAGGVLTDDTIVYVRAYGGKPWIEAHYWQWKEAGARYSYKYYECIIATSAGKPEEE